MSNTLKLEVGKRYVRRDGLVSGPLEHNDNSNLPWRDSLTQNTYYHDGHFYYKTEDGLDLVAEYQEPEYLSGLVEKLQTDLEFVSKRGEEYRQKAEEWQNHFHTANLKANEWAFQAISAQQRIAELEAQIEQLTPKPKVESVWYSVHINCEGALYTNSHPNGRPKAHEGHLLYRKDTITHPDGQVEYKVEVEEV